MHEVPSVARLQGWVSVASVGVQLCAIPRDAGLYDYLTAPVAAALTRRMFEMTAPGGTLLVPNFLTDIADQGYMESFMDWHLIYRDHADMRAIAKALPEAEVADVKIFNDPTDTIVFLQVRKARAATVIC